MAHKLKITIKGSEPKIFRMVLVPENFTFLQLHLIIQCAFNWSDDHLFQFYLGRLYDSDSVHSPDDEDIDDDFIFRRHDKYDARKTKLTKLLQEGLKKFYYIYDFGDNWVHEITVLKKPSEEVLYPVCIKGENIAPVEDCGGIYGFYDMLATLENPGSENEKREIEEWLGLLPGQKLQDVRPFDIDEINEGFLAIFRQ